MIIAPEVNPNNILSIVLAGQFAVFGWRVNREIAVGDAGRRTWLPITDAINLASMLATLAMCVIAPLVNGRYDRVSFAMLSTAAVLLVFHPICLVGHYRLFTNLGRHIYTNIGDDYPYCTGIEGILTALAVLAASLSAALVWRAVP